ncbi:MAG TPA: COX15/CtaA family protein [Chitinophagales bacterium]|nr:COX15/CtaA family protein [Chitinophagales bacterium]HMZ89978.1 COX15/CtaA family protein [Chitinophagales bacterium]HNE46806.1 COX15/CtaA family protein [Chitinophagales bacterium]HNI54575.1 COX15/CtaA family protein [Chitinophagales bacterium]HNK98157.1 COX15/CtaA family protein [Chitinophagales bacterium]
MRNVRIWLWTGVVMILIQVMLGGITRLTESGLSIVEWDVVMGSMPPTSQSAWEEEFAKYQQTAQFEKVNTDFTVSDFKRIYWWEFIHRLWARTLGFVFLIPFIWFWIKKQLNASWKKKLIFVFVLGGLQGFVGWVMVASGLDGDPWVDPSKLTIHLLLALTLYMYLIWLAQDTFGKIAHKPIAKGNMNWITALIFIQIGLGGIMAGTDAGRLFNTWPLMNGAFLPDGAFSNLSQAEKLTQLTTEINFIHRTFALIVATAVIIYWYRNRHTGSQKLKQLNLTMVLLVVLQCVLGVLTLLNGSLQIPVFLGVAHQITACILLATAVLIMHRVKHDGAS